MVFTSIVSNAVKCLKLYHNIVSFSNSNKMDCFFYHSRCITLMECRKDTPEHFCRFESMFHRFRKESIAYSTDPLAAMPSGFYAFKPNCD